MTDDCFTAARWRDVCDAFNATLRDRPLRRGEAVYVVAGEPPRRALQHDLADELRADGLGTLARKVASFPVPLGHALIVSVGSDVRLFVVEITDVDVRPARSRVVGPSVHGVLGVLGAAGSSGAR